MKRMKEFLTKMVSVRADKDESAEEEHAHEEMAEEEAAEPLPENHNEFEQFLDSTPSPYSKEGRQAETSKHTTTNIVLQKNPQRYETLEKIGEGGTSVVYRAFDNGIGREVALKRFNPGMGPEARGSEYEKEIQIISRISHPNTVTTHDLGEDNEGHFLIMELIKGKDLKEVFGGKVMKLTHFRSLAMQCMDGLAAIHKAKVLHLDIKPSNVMISLVGGRRMHAKIIDFGASKLMQGSHLDNQDAAHTGPHGTIHYMSPEQLNSEPLDRRCDIYGMGCMFYELLTGEPPFQGETTIQVMASHITNRYEPLADVRIDLPKKLDDLIHSMMSKNREDRPESAGIVAAAIEEIEWAS